jgi:hypothetical protein
MLTKPAGVFVQLLGLIALVGVPASMGYSTGSWIVGLLVCLGLLWLGRKTRA